MNSPDVGSDSSLKYHMLFTWLSGEQQDLAACVKNSTLIWVHKLMGKKPSAGSLIDHFVCHPLALTKMEIRNVFFSKFLFDKLGPCSGQHHWVLVREAVVPWCDALRRFNVRLLAAYVIGCFSKSSKAIFQDPSSDLPSLRKSFETTSSRATSPGRVWQNITIIFLSSPAGIQTTRRPSDWILIPCKSVKSLKEGKIENPNRVRAWGSLWPAKESKSGTTTSLKRSVSP